MDHYTVERTQAQALRAALLDHNWQRYLDSHIAHKMGAQRRAAMGLGSTSFNLFESVVTKLSVLYNREPGVFAEMDETEAAQFKSLHLFSQSQRHCKNVVGLGESMIHLGWTPGNHLAASGLTIELVQPQNVEVTTLPSAPSVPVQVKQRTTHTVKGKSRQCFDVWNIADPAHPYFAVTSSDGKTDYTKVLGLDADYPYVDERGPFLPWVLYHAEDTGQLWDYNTWGSLVEGTLDSGMLVTHWLHAMTDASWQQKYAVDVEMGNASTINLAGKPAKYMETDPTTVIMLSSVQDKSGTIGTLSVPVDVQGMIMSIRDFVSAILDQSGLSGQDIDAAQSGLAITLRKDTIREYQRKYEPGFRRGDLEMISTAARINNIYSPIEIPVSGYTIRYHGIPDTHAQVVERLARQKSLIDLGLSSKVMAVMENEHMTEREAIDYLRRIKVHQSL